MTKFEESVKLVHSYFLNAENPNAVGAESILTEWENSLSVVEREGYEREKELRKSVISESIN